MINYNVYKSGIVVGVALLFVTPIIEMLFSIDVRFGALRLSIIGSLTLAIILLSNYYTTHGDANKYKLWWQGIAGFYFLIFFFVSFLDTGLKPKINILLYAIFGVLLYVQYNRIQK